MLKFETIETSISACPYGKLDKDGRVIMIGSYSCTKCSMYKGKGNYLKTIICKAEEKKDVIIKDC